MRRAIGLLLALIVLATPAFGQSYTASNLYAAQPPLRIARGLITHGQSHQGLCWESMTDYGVRTMAGLLFTPKLLATTAFPSLMMTVAASKPTQLLIDKMGVYLPDMVISYPPPASPNDFGNCMTISRGMQISQQYFRLMHGVQAPDPTMEINIMCGGSSWVEGPCGGLGPPTATFTGSIAPGLPSIMTVTNAVGTIIAHQRMIALPGGVTVNKGTQFDDFGTNGTTGVGGNGTYTVLNFNVFEQTVPAEPMYSVSNAWDDLRAMLPSIIRSFPDPDQNLGSIVFEDVDYLDAGSFSRATTAPTVAETTAMVAAFDAEPMPGNTGSSLKYFIGVQCPTTTPGQNNTLGMVEFARALIPAGRIIPTSPICQWALAGDGVHTAAFGVQRLGELLGLIKYIVKDRGILFRPLWLSLTAPITTSGTKILIPFDRPLGEEYAAGVLQWRADADEGLIDWPQKGFHVYRSGVEIPLCATPAIVGLIVELDICQSGQPGDEISYMQYGPGGTGTRYPVGGNLAMSGPPSIWFPGRDIPMFGWPFKVNLP